jgi:hypothetical protein
MRGPAFFAYADNDLIDLKAAVIVDVDVNRHRNVDPIRTGATG